MARSWICHWQNRYWRSDVNAEYRPVCSSGSNSFRKRGVAPGDFVYVVSLAAGRLLLGGRMRVKEIVSRDDAVQIRGTDSLYDAQEWIIGDDKSGTPLNLHRELAFEVSSQLRLLSARGEPKPLFFRGTHVDRQATRGIRELTPDSAALLDRIIALSDDLPRTGQLIVVTSEMLGSDRVRLPEEIENSPRIREGARYRITVNAYERDPRARRICIATHGAKCCICGLSFVDVYGQVAEGLIHVHHLRPLSEIGEEYVIDPVVDLRPVCPNCHAVLHYRDPAYSLDEVRQFLESRRNSRETD